MEYYHGRDTLYDLEKKDAYMKRSKYLRSATIEWFNTRNEAQLIDYANPFRENVETQGRNIHQVIELLNSYDNKQLKRIRRYMENIRPGETVSVDDAAAFVGRSTGVQEVPLEFDSGP